MLFPAFLAYYYQESDALVFFACSVFCGFLGFLFTLSNNCEITHITVKQSFLLTNMSWVTICLAGALPLYLSYHDLSFTDAVFESVSGFTTTGSTILTQLDQAPKGVLLWRSITQWLGGIGIIAFAIVILPYLKVGGMQLFQTESSDKSGKIIPKLQDFMRSLLLVYFAITLMCMLTYFLLGMDWFEALNHALTTVPTGGFSIYDSSFGHFSDRPLLIIACIFFMLMGSIPFVLYIRLLHKKGGNVFKDEQVVTMLLILGVLSCVLAIWMVKNLDMAFGTSFLDAAFNLTSVMTTTGYATQNYSIWGPFVVMLFFFLTYLGACAGSTSGGIKLLRFIIVLKAVAKHLKSLRFPRGVFTIKYQGRPVDKPIVLNVMAFLCLYVVINTFLTIALSLTGLDFITSISGAATAIANVGPGLGDVIGPAGNFSTLPDISKWLLVIGMIVGRLEIITVLVLLNPKFWRS